MYEWFVPLRLIFSFLKKRMMVGNQHLLDLTQYYWRECRRSRGQRNCTFLEVVSSSTFVIISASPSRGQTRAERCIAPSRLQRLATAESRRKKTSESAKLRKRKATTGRSTLPRCAERRSSNAAPFASGTFSPHAHPRKWRREWKLACDLIVQELRRLSGEER